MSVTDLKPYHFIAVSIIDRIVPTTEGHLLATCIHAYGAEIMQRTSGEITNDKADLLDPYQYIWIMVVPVSYCESPSISRLVSVAGISLVGLLNLDVHVGCDWSVILSSPMHLLVYFEGCQSSGWPKTRQWVKLGSNNQDLFVDAYYPRTKRPYPWQFTWVNLRPDDLYFSFPS